MQDEEKRKRIVEASIPMFNQLGCKAVTMDSLAKTLHISKRTMYEMFVNKETLMLECISEVHKTMWRRGKEITSRASEPFLMALFLTRNEALICLRFSRILKDAERFYPELTTQVVKKFTEKFKLALWDLFSKAAKNGDLRPDIDIREIVETLAMSVHVCSLSSMHDNEALANLIRESFFTYLRGTLSIKAIERYDKNVEEYRKLVKEEDETIGILKPES